jgi:hypothetical protein
LKGFVSRSPSDISAIVIYGVEGIVKGKAVDLIDEEWSEVGRREGSFG